MQATPWSGSRVTPQGVQSQVFPVEGIAEQYAKCTGQALNSSEAVIQGDWGPLLIAHVRYEAQKG